MNDEIELIPFHTREAAEKVDELGVEAKHELSDIEGLQHFLRETINTWSLNELPNTEEFEDRWQNVYNPEEEYSAFPGRLDSLMEELGLEDPVYADMYEEFAVVPQHTDSAGEVVKTIQENDVITPHLAGRIYDFLEVSQEVRRDQLNDIRYERQRLQSYVEGLDEIVQGFDVLNGQRGSVDVESTDYFWDQLESFEDRVNRMQVERQQDYRDRVESSADFHSFLNDFYRSHVGVDQPVMYDLDAVDSRIDEARNGIV